MQPSTGKQPTTGTPPKTGTQPTTGKQPATGTTKTPNKNDAKPVKEEDKKKQQ